MANVKILTFSDLTTSFVDIVGNLLNDFNPLLITICNNEVMI
jgi:hypothetical protein